MVLSQELCVQSEGFREVVTAFMERRMGAAGR